MNEINERIKGWLNKADHDLGTAIVINEHISEYSDTLAFHCQQAVEKYIKCLLLKNSISFRRSHDLRYLLDLLEEVVPVSEDLFDKIIKLNAFSVEIRYPDIVIEVSQDDRESAISTAKEVREFLKAHIGFEIE
jgi:HEPN domain-containing protein